MKKIVAIGIILFLYTFFVGAQSSVQRSQNLDDLAEKYAPNFWFDSEEKYFPCDYSDYFYENSRERQGAQAKAIYDTLSTKEKIQAFKVFYHISQSSQETAIQYWLFYVFNDFDNQHYGDAESVTVFIDKQSGQIRKIIGSAHIGSQTKIILANNELDHFQQQHINILVEKGSHANFPDRNGNGLAEVKDLSNWYNAYGISGWDERDKNTGILIKHNDPSYQMASLNEIENKLQGKLFLTKSENLGVKIPIKSILSFNNFSTDIYIPIGGSPISFGDIKPKSADPQSAVPITPGYFSKMLLEKQIFMPSPILVDAKNRITKIIKKNANPQIPDNKPTKKETDIKISENTLKKMSKLIEQIPVDSKDLPQLEIHLICPGINSSDKEIIEIKNTGNFAVDLEKEKIKFAFITQSGEEKGKRIKYINQIIKPKSSLLLASDENLYNPDGIFSAGLAKNGGVRIYAGNNLLNELQYGNMPTSSLKIPLSTNNCAIKDKDAVRLTKEICPQNSKPGSQPCFFLDTENLSEKQTNDSIVQRPVFHDAPKNFYEVIISEIMYNIRGGDQGNEWVEIYNSTDQEIDLTGWDISDNSGLHFIKPLSSSNQKFLPKSYIILSSKPELLEQKYPECQNKIYKANLSLANSQGEIKISNDGFLIDSATYASSSGANGDGNTLQMINSLVIPAPPTPCAPNGLSSSSTVEIPTNSNNQIDYSCIKINEIMYDPPGNDSKKEWIEIRNLCTDLIDITKLQLEESDQKHHILAEEGNIPLIEPNDFAILTNDPASFLIDHPGIKNIYKCALNLKNAGEKINLIADSSIIDTISYYPSSQNESNEQGNSWQLFSSNWHYSFPTPGKENQLFSPFSVSFSFSPPVPIQNENIIFTAQLSQNIEKDALNFHWDFGDGNNRDNNTTTIDYFFNSTGTFSVILEVKQNERNYATSYTNQIVIEEPKGPLYSEPTSLAY